MGAEARCSDGPGGKVVRVIVDPASDTVTHLVIEPRRKDVVIPASAVTRVEDGIWLNLTKEQVEDLPPTADSR